MFGFFKKENYLQKILQSHLYLFKIYLKNIYNIYKVTKKKEFHIKILILNNGILAH